MGHKKQEQIGLKGRKPYLDKRQEGEYLRGGPAPEPQLILISI